VCVCVRCAYNATPPALPPRIQYQYLTCCIAIGKRRIFAFYCISFGLSSAFKSSVKCFSMLHFLRVPQYIHLCICTDTHIRIYVCGFSISNLPAQTESNCETHLNDAPENILSLFAYCALIGPKIEYNFNSSVDQA